MSGQVVVCGLGQTLRGDDAAGLIVVRRWQAQYPQTARHPRVTVHLLELPGFALLGMLEGAESALLVDVAVSGAPPGTLHWVQPDRLEAFAAGSTSAHGWGVAETLRLARALRRPLPSRLDVLAIEAADFNLGAALSPEVEAVLPDAVEAVEAWVRRCLHAEMADA